LLSHGHALNRPAADCGTAASVADLPPHFWQDELQPKIAIDPVTVSSYPSVDGTIYIQLVTTIATNYPENNDRIQQQRGRY
jgi:hypothetical protein